MPICLHICFHATELSIWDRCVTHKAYIYYLALYRNGLADSWLKPWKYMIYILMVV